MRLTRKCTCGARTSLSLTGELNGTNWTRLGQRCVILTSMEETNLLRKMTWMHPTVSVTDVSTLDMSR